MVRIRDGERQVARWREYDSLQELCGVSCHPVNRRHADASVFGGRRDGSDHWRGGIGTTKAFRDLVNGGWREGAARMREAIGQLSVPAVRSIKRRQVWREDGDEVDMGRVYAGELETAWRGTVRREVSSIFHVRITINTSAAARREADTLFWRGACACLLVDALEKAGYRAEVIAYHQGRDVYGMGNPDHLISAPLKSSEEPLDIDRMAACTAHAAMLRCAVFGEMLSAPYAARQNLGYPIHDRNYFAEGEHVINVDNVWTVEEARRFLERELARFGGAEKS